MSEDNSVAQLEESNLGPFGFIGEDDDVPITTKFVETLVRQFVGEVITQRTQRALGAITGGEYAEALKDLAERDEAILYGNVAGYQATSHWDENGLGRDLASKLGESDPEGQVFRRLLHLALDVGRVYDRAAVDTGYDWRLDMDVLIQNMVSELTGVPVRYSDPQSRPTDDPGSEAP